MGCVWHPVYTHQLQHIFQVAVFQLCLWGQQKSKPTGASVGPVRLLLEQSERSLGCVNSAALLSLCLVLPPFYLACLQSLVSLWSLSPSCTVLSSLFHFIHSLYSRIFYSFFLVTLINCSPVLLQHLGAQRSCSDPFLLQRLSHNLIQNEIINTWVRFLCS